MTAASEQSPAPIPGAGVGDGPGHDLELRQPGAVSLARQSLAGRVAVLRRNLPELARHPAVVATASATATLGVRLAARALSELLAARGEPSRELVKATGPAGPAGPVTAVFVGHVDVVVHHVLHRVDRS